MYGSLAAFRAYWDDRGSSAPTDAADALATAALVRASDYIKYRYVANLSPGYDDTLDIVELATYEAALLELGAVGFFSKTYTASQQKVLTGAGQIRWTVTGDSSKTYSASPVSTIIEAMFEPYIIDRDKPGFYFETVGL